MPQSATLPVCLSVRRTIDSYRRLCSGVSAAASVEFVKIDIEGLHSLGHCIVRIRLSNDERRGVKDSVVVVYGRRSWVRDSRGKFSTNYGGKSMKIV